MIQTTSTAYWSTGITVRYAYSGGGHYGWGASLQFLDDGFADDDADAGQVSTQGTLTTRYYVTDGEHVSGLSAAVDAMIADAERLGIKFSDVCGPYLHYEDDSSEFPPPDGWQALLDAEAARIGWKSYGADLQPKEGKP